MAIRRFVEGELVESLERLSARLRVVFAAACAERLLPAYIASPTPAGDPSALRGILSRLWEDLEGKPMTELEVDAELDACMGIIENIVPGEDNAGAAVVDHALAEDAASATAYALRCRRSGDGKEAAWAARRAYETVDQYVVDREGVNLNAVGAEELLIEHPLVQAELERQHRDLDDLGAAAADKVSHVARRFRDRATSEGAVLFGSRPK